jgi:hypothetical protein
MHTYKDAIRRTSGAYIIYPGTEKKTFRGFHEIIPGLGAFCLTPKNIYKNSQDLEHFIRVILNHMLNRASQREKVSYHINNIYSKDTASLNASLPEPVGQNRNLIPDETYVIIDSYRDDNHLKWIQKNNIYNTIIGTTIGSIPLNKEITSAKYLLLHKSNNQLLIRLSDNGPRMMTKASLMKEYKSSTYTPSEPYYIVFDISSFEPEKEFEGVKWDLSKMAKKGVIKSAEPVGISLTKLMEYLKRD